MLQQRGGGENSQQIQSGAYSATGSASSLLHSSTVQVVIFFRPFPPLVVAATILLLGSLSRLIARCRQVSSFSLCQEVMKFSVSCSTPYLCHRTPLLRCCCPYSALSNPKVHLSIVVIRTVRGPEGLEIDLQAYQSAKICSGLPLPPSTTYSLPNINRGR